MNNCFMYELASTFETFSVRRGKMVHCEAFTEIHLPKLGFSPPKFSFLSAAVQGKTACQVTTYLDHGLLEVGAHRHGVVPRMGNKRGERDGTLGG